MNTNVSPMEREPAPGTSRVRVFISHSSRDKELAEAVVTCLRGALQLPLHEPIRCSSLSGYGLDKGAKISDGLRRDLNDCDVVIPLFTRSSLKAPYVLMEIGAGWAMGKHICPIVHKIEQTRVPVPVMDFHASDSRTIRDMKEFVSVIGGLLGYDIKVQSLDVALASLVSTAIRVDRRRPLFVTLLVLFILALAGVTFGLFTAGSHEVEGPTAGASRPSNSAYVTAQAYVDCTNASPGCRTFHELLSQPLELPVKAPSEDALRYCELRKCALPTPPPDGQSTETEWWADSTRRVFRCDCGAAQEYE